MKKKYFKKRILTTAVLTLALMLQSLAPVIAANLSYYVNFIDLKTSHWAYKNIQTLVALGGIKGYPGNTFQPEGSITYAELTSILLGATGKDNTITTGNWSREMLQKAYENKILDSKTVPLTDASRPVKRDRMAMILANSAIQLKGEDLTTRSDIHAYVRDWNTIASAYQFYVNQAVSAGFIVGDQNGNFKADDNLTRAEAATICLRLIDPKERLTPTPFATDKKDYEQQVVNLVNQERATAGLPALKVNTMLSQLAELKAKDMRDNNYFSHTSPTYGSPFDMMTQYGIDYTAAGENIAKGQRTPEIVMNGWMNSQGHKENILNSNFTEIGVGYLTDSKGTTYWVQMFIRP